MLVCVFFPFPFKLSISEHAVGRHWPPSLKKGILLLRLKSDGVRGKGQGRSIQAVQILTDLGRFPRVDALRVNAPTTVGLLFCVFTIRFTSSSSAHVP